MVHIASLARRHRVEALFWNGLKLADVPIPQDLSAALHSDAEQVQARHLMTASAIGEIWACAKTVHLDILLIKGLATGAIGYTSAVLKSGRDIDILVHRNDVAVAAACLRSLNYRQDEPRGDIEHWHRRRKESVWSLSDGMVVELHSALADNRALIPSIGMGSPRQTIPTPAVECETLALPELIAYSCVHGASSLWFRVKWLVDLAALLHARHGDDFADESYHQSVALGAGVTAGQAFLLCHQFLGTAIGPSLQTHLYNSARIKLLNRLTMRALTSGEPTERTFGTLPIRASQPLYMPSVSGAASEVVRQLREVVDNRRR